MDARGVDPPSRAHQRIRGQRVGGGKGTAPGIIPSALRVQRGPDDNLLRQIDSRGNTSGVGEREIVCGGKRVGGVCISTPRAVGDRVVRSADLIPFCPGDLGSRRVTPPTSWSRHRDKDIGINGIAA